MRIVKLIKLNAKYAEDIHRLSQAAAVKNALGLPDQTVADTHNFIQHSLMDEKDGKTVSRLIINEHDQLIGITSLMFIDKQKNSCHIGSWIGQDYWGQGYNISSKIEILKLAFLELGLDIVFAGARAINIRSQKAQEKLPFIRLGVEVDFPEEHAFLEAKEKQPCVLNAFYREDFLSYLNEVCKN